MKLALISYLPQPPVALTVGMPRATTFCIVHGNFVECLLERAGPTLILVNCSLFSWEGKPKGYKQSSLIYMIPYILFPEYWTWFKTREHWIWIMESIVYQFLWDLVGPYGTWMILYRCWKTWVILGPGQVPLLRPHSDGWLTSDMVRLAEDHCTRQVGKIHRDSMGTFMASWGIRNEFSEFV